MEKKVNLINPGQGWNTPGKCSPDKSLMEWEYNREISKRCRDIFKEYGWDSRLVVFEDYDIDLSERARRVNDICNAYGSSNVLLIDVHVNAAGSEGKWMNGKGWECWTTIGQTNSDKLAEELYKAASIYLKYTQMRIDQSDGDKDKEKNYTVIYKVKCPAVLTENLFMDNKQECEFLLSEEGKQAIVNLHVDGILKYMEKYW